MTARERINLLAGSRNFFELGAFAAHGMYEEWGGAAAAGVITGLARIQTRLVMIIANAVMGKNDPALTVASLAMIITKPCLDACQSCDYSGRPRRPTLHTCRARQRRRARKKFRDRPAG